MLAMQGGFIFVRFTYEIMRVCLLSASFDFCTLVLQLSEQPSAATGCLSQMIRREYIYPRHRFLDRFADSLLDQVIGGRVDDWS